ncbi:MAG: carbamoyltransferase HypF [Candidatus Bathyarchaeia archaeon]
MRAEIRVSGIVQGVGFRPFVYRIAVKNGLVGFVRNRGDATVDIVVEGERNAVRIFLKDLREKSPPLARIHNISVGYSEDKGEFKSFEILRSSKRSDLSGSTIPPDIAICDECLRELRNPKNRRYNYFFITCTDCGPRYTIIEGLPYDRPNTTMKDFPMCSSCLKEYTDPSDRRFHAQTVACKDCGPRVYLTTNDGETITCKDPIREAGRLLEEGYVVAVKGNGGFHVATATTKSEPILRLRKVKHRSQKPFAIMAKDLETVKSFAIVSRYEAELLTSHIRPIVLLRKSENYYLSEFISPGLHNVGVMLPYTGLHVMMFDEAQEPAFVMTSANPPNEPIVIEDREALRRLGGEVDFFLFHNRTIAYRCDDSVVRLHGRERSIIRRSRGYSPEPLRLRFSSDRCVLAVGAEENVNVCILSGDRAFISQYVGDVENLETLQFLRDTIDHLLDLTKIKVDVIACDLHPRFNTTRLARELGERLNRPVVQVQHHHAHAAGLMAEHGVDEIIGIICDGYGYGLDGEAWGGEILYCNPDGVKRLAHLERQPMAGGDLATLYPLRMAAGILQKAVDIEDWLYSKVECFPHGGKEVDIVIKQLKDETTLKTTSCGRVLDAVSSVLGVCYHRTYEGEPAMKLESMAVGGRDVLELKPRVVGGTVDTTFMVSEVFEKRDEYPTRDLAYSAESYIARGLAQLAIEEAERLSVKTVGFSGGVAYNEHITNTIRRVVKKNGLDFFVHHDVPPGDGGISFGQAVSAARLSLFR